MVVKVAFWYELWTSLMDLCWIIFLLSDLITEQALILLHAQDEMEEAPNKRNALASPMDNVFVEILRRLPAYSLFCYKYVCRSWRRLISNNHKLMPHTMADFFNDGIYNQRNFTSITGVYLSLSFLPFTMNNVAVLDSYNGLILC
jgi:hypothetical protein